MSSQGFFLPSISDSTLRAAVVAAQQRWPQVHVSDALFRQHISQCIARLRAGLTKELRVESLHLVDLFLVCAVICGTPSAAQAFEQTFLTNLAHHIPTKLRDTQLADDIVQEVRIKLLVDTPARPSKLHTYLGQSPLGGWIPRIVRSTAWDLERCHTKGSIQAMLWGSGWVEAVIPAHERDLAKAAHQDLLRQACEAALTQCSGAERVLLYRVFRAGHSLAQIATELGEHRSSTKRRMDALFSRLRTQVLSAMHPHLSLPDAELLSLLRILISRISDERPELLGDV
jgi:RNA polymerase sigma-70 factor